MDHSNYSNPTIIISIISHRHGQMVKQLLADLAQYCGYLALRVEITVNITEDLKLISGDYPFPISVYENRVPKGFAANHNAAFMRTKGVYYCVLNPDVRIFCDPFTHLIRQLNGAVAVIAPKVVDGMGKNQCTARRLPTPTEITRRLLGLHLVDYDLGKGPIYPDWVAGMFMLFRSDVYEAISGFNENYFLYYEDVELCTRVRLKGLTVCLDPAIAITHDGSYASHRHLRYFLLHVTSIFRFWTSDTYRKARSLM